MIEIGTTLQLIAFILLFLLFFKDMSGHNELKEIKKELKRIADTLERREKE